MEAMMKECMKPHALMHLLTGLGVGLLLVGLVPTLASNALIWGIVIIVVGMLGDMWVQSKK